MIKYREIILNTLLLLLIMFFARGPFYQESTFFSRIILIILLGISSLYLAKTLLNKNKSSFYIYWLMLLSLNVLGFAFTGNLSNPLHTTMFISIIIAMLPFFPFYYFAKKGVLTEKHLRWFLLLVLPIVITKYYYTELTIMVERSLSDNYLTNNTAYYFTALVPFLFFMKKKKVFAYIISFVLVFFIVSSAKRGAILIAIVGMCYFLYYQLRTANKKEIYLTTILVLIAIIILIYFGYKYVQSNEYLLNRLEKTSEGDSSGRDIIYRNIFFSWFNTPNLLNFIFGFGFAASTELSTTGNFAHNDWLEILSNFGLVGVLLYSLLIYSLLSFVRSSLLPIDKKIVLTTIFSLWLLTSFFSMVYSSSTTAIQSLLIAYIIGSAEKDHVI